MPAPDSSRHAPAPTELEEQHEPLYSDVAPIPSSRLPPAYRLTGLRPNSVPPSSAEQVVFAIMDVLLAAAYADGEMCGREQRTVRRILERLLETESLPRDL